MEAEALADSVDVDRGLADSMGFASLRLCWRLADFVSYSNDLWPKEFANKSKHHIEYSIR